MGELKSLLIDSNAEMPTRANNSKRNLKLAWCAGFIDGEGYIGTSECTKKTQSGSIRWFSIIVDVSQVRREPLMELQRYLGGTVRAFKTRYGIHHSWRAYGDKSAYALGLVLPYLVNKRRQAELALEFQKTKRVSWEKVAPETHARREAIHLEFRILNAKRKRVDAERLSEETPRKVGRPRKSVDDAIVRTAANTKAAEVSRNVSPVVVH